jgi:molybdate transport system substrate-binding protein
MALRRPGRLWPLRVPASGALAAIAGALAIAALAIGGCRPPDDELVVLAAASLSEPFRELARLHEHDAGGTVRLGFAGSQTVAGWVREGARADVVATADERILDELATEGLLIEARTFATNQLVWVFARDSDPAGEPLASWLGRPDVRLVIAAPEVPAGAYALAALDALGLRPVALERVVSRELDVNGVLAKVRLGGADAGLVYASDVAGERRADLIVRELTRGASPVARYRVGVSPDAASAARTFVDLLLSPRGQEVLRASGFGPP